jgi:hypothetical protein
MRRARVKERDIARPLFSLACNESRWRLNLVLGSGRVVYFFNESECELPHASSLLPSSPAV